MISFLLHCDDNLFILINSHHIGLGDIFFYLITWLGNGWVITPILLIIAYAKVPKKRLWLFILVSASGMIASGLINSKIKDITDRPRPVVYFSQTHADTAVLNVPHFNVHVVGQPLAYRSFPSGHTNTAFSAATLIALAFGGWFWLAFIPAALVGYSRMYMGLHFPLDVAAGALLGLFVMSLTVFLYKKMEKR
jgi:membrane-associated phospholipid phosphatase